MFTKPLSSAKFLFVVVCAFVMLSFSDEKDPLHKRVFTISLGETKEGVPSKKNIMDKWYFKDGKMFSDFLSNKYSYSWFRYRINKDSVYTDSTNTEVRLLEVEGSSTDENNQTVIVNFIQEEWDLDGEIKITKNDKVKRMYVVAGREKGGKPKKEKKGEKKILEVVPEGKQPEKMYKETISVPSSTVR